MNFNVNNGDVGTGELTKWELTKPALTNAAAAMPESLAAGMNFFPNIDVLSPCILNEVAVPMEAMTQPQRERFSAALNAVKPSGGTPTYDAWIFGYQVAKAASVEGAKFVVLITDGAPSFGRNCSQMPDNAGLIRDIAAVLAADQILTFVVGSPGSQGSSDVDPIIPDGRPDLSRMAEAGGTAPTTATGALDCDHAGPKYCHFDVSQETTDFSAALLAALNEVIARVQVCK